ncbi:uncharacterized protein LOC110692188 [Chenopodium quinoa]|uniref:uncharacterized protein LOC110692188 n=1 Tax=Chenopodium quinoa TaxID=63459 RepID=UPI000B77F1C5|nr:uncharacterized protein LOC110692188 [Chenopodium quinoa]
MTTDPSSKSSVVSPFHPALGVTNIRNLVPLVLDGESVQYTPWATLFRNTAKVYQVLDHIDSSVSKPRDIDDELWDRLDAAVLQWLYGTISTDLLYRILDEKSTTMVAWHKLKALFQDNEGTRIVHLENQFRTITLTNSTSLAQYC